MSDEFNEAINESLVQRERRADLHENKLSRLGRPHSERSINHANRTIQRFLESKNPKNVHEKSRLLELVNAMFAVATTKNHPKQIDAAKLLIERGYGKPKISDEEADAIARQGIQIVYIHRPEIDQVDEAKPHPAPQPDFIDAEVVSNGEG